MDLVTPPKLLEACAILILDPFNLACIPHLYCPLRARKMNASELTRLDPAILSIATRPPDFAHAQDIARLDPAIAAIGARITKPDNMASDGRLGASSAAPTKWEPVRRAMRHELGSVLDRPAGPRPTLQQHRMARLDSLARSRAPWPPRVPSLIPYSPPSRPLLLPRADLLSSQSSESPSPSLPSLGSFSPVSPCSAVSPKTRAPALGSREPLARRLALPSVPAPPRARGPGSPVFLHSPELRFSTFGSDGEIREEIFPDGTTHVITLPARHDRSPTAASPSGSERGLLRAPPPSPALCGLAPTLARALLPRALRHGWIAARVRVSRWLHGLADAVASEAERRWREHVAGAKGVRDVEWRREYPARMGRDEEEGFTYVVGEEEDEDAEEGGGELDGEGTLPESPDWTRLVARGERGWIGEVPGWYEARAREVDGAAPDGADARWITDIGARVRARDRRQRGDDRESMGPEAWHSSVDDGRVARPYSCPDPVEAFGVRKNRFLRNKTHG